MARVQTEGATLHYDTNATASPHSWTAFGLVTSLPTGSSTRPELDATALEDTASVFFLGKTDYGSTTVEFFMDPASTSQYKAAFDAQVAGTEWAWKITDKKSVVGAANGATHVFRGSIRELSTGRTVNGMVTGTMSIRISGVVTYTKEA